MDEEKKEELQPLVKTGLEGELLEWLKPVQDPELYLSLVELGLIYDLTVQDGKAFIKMTLTSPACPVGPQLVEEVRKRAVEHEAINEVVVEVVWEPKWDPRKMASDECKEALGLW